MARPRWGGGSGASPGFTTDGHLRLPAHPVPASPPRRPRFLQRPARAVGAQPEVSCSRGCDPASRWLYAIYTCATGKEGRRGEGRSTTARRVPPRGGARKGRRNGAGEGSGGVSERRRHTTAQPWRSSAARRWRNEKKMNRERGRRRIEKERLTSGTMGKLIFNQSFSLHFDRK
ncbi:hypothetical protein EE612_029612 [Oryza sativa]|nr:hypothetical protein EE612_029612 [Oryza sativa]